MASPLHERARQAAAKRIRWVQRDTPDPAGVRQPPRWAVAPAKRHADRSDPRDGERRRTDRSPHADRRARTDYGAVARFTLAWLLVAIVVAGMIVAMVALLDHDALR